MPKKSKKIYIYVNKKKLLDKNKHKYCRCILHVSKNNTKKCNLNKSWNNINIKNCYNPFTICASSLGTTTGGKPCYYLFKDGNIPYEELESYTYLNFNLINKWCKIYNISLKKILKTGNENKLKLLLDSWYKDKLLEKNK